MDMEDMDMEIGGEREEEMKEEYANDTQEVVIYIPSKQLHLFWTKT